MSQRPPSVYRMKASKRRSEIKQGRGRERGEERGIFLKRERETKCLCDQRVTLKVRTKVTWLPSSSDHRGKQGRGPSSKGPHSQLPGSWRTLLIHHTHLTLWIHTRQLSLSDHTPLALIHTWQTLLSSHTHLALGTHT